MRFPSQYSCNGARIDASAQKCAQGNLADEPASYRVDSEVSKRLDGIGKPQPPVCKKGRFPITSDVMASAIDGERAAWLQLKHVPINRLGIGNISKGQKIANAAPAHRSVETGHGGQGLQFGGEAESDAWQGERVIQRLLAQPVPGEEHLLTFSIPDCKCEHAVEQLGHSLPGFFIKMNEHFCVAVAGESVPFFDQFSPQGLEVVNLPVEDDLDRPILVGQRLVPSLPVNNAQAAMPERRVLVTEKTRGIRPAVEQTLAHPLHDAAVGRDRIASQVTGDSTHVKFSKEGAASPFHSHRRCERLKTQMQKTTPERQSWLRMPPGWSRRSVVIVVVPLPEQGFLSAVDHHAEQLFLGDRLESGRKLCPIRMPGPHDEHNAVERGLQKIVVRDQPDRRRVKNCKLEILA